MVNKKFQGYLLLNWKSGEVKYTKRKPKTVGGYAIPLKLDINLELPDPTDYKITGNIIIPPAKAKEIMVENL